MTQLNQSTFDGLIEFIELDLTGFGDSVYRYVNTSTFAADLPEFGTIRFRGQDYQPYPFISAGFQRGGENLVQPTIQLPDFMGAMAVVLSQYDNAPGAPVTRYQALKADIISGNQQAAFQTEMYLLDSVSSDGLQLELSLATHLDFKRAKFPGFKMTREFYPGLGSNLQR